LSVVDEGKIVKKNELLILFEWVNESTY
jgi:hypothetical protein